MNRSFGFLVFISAVLGLCGNADAGPLHGTEAGRPVPDHGPVQPYLRTHFELRKEVDRGRGYRNLDDEDRSRLFQAQDSLFALLGQVRNFQDLSPEQRVQLAEIHAVLLPAMDVVVGSRTNTSCIIGQHC